jgi:hypothetical protein
MVHAALFFSRRTPLNFFLPFFTSMNLPDVLSRFPSGLAHQLALKLRALFHRADASVVAHRFVACHFSFSPWDDGRLFEGHLKVRYPTVLAQEVIKRLIRNLLERCRTVACQQIDRGPCFIIELNALPGHVLTTGPTGAGS